MKKFIIILHEFFNLCKVICFNIIIRTIIIVKITDKNNKSFLKIIKYKLIKSGTS